MDKITCKNCGTKYPGEVAKCPVCGASNLPSVSGDFEFLDDDFEVKTDKPAETAPVEKAAPAAPAAPAESAAPEKPVSKDTGAYNWEDIIAEINGTKPAEKTAEPEPETKWVPEEPKKAAPAAPAWKQMDEDDEDDEDDEEEKPRPVRQPRERRQSSKSGTAVLAVVLVAALLVVAFFAAKHFGLFVKEEPEPETPELPVAQEKDVDCTGVALSVNELTLTAEGASETLTATLTPADCTEKVNWVSADPSVAIVDANGKVTAVAEGKANILVSCGDYAATCMVTVDFTLEDETGEEEPEQEPETDAPMELSATDITMTYPGELARLYVNNSGDKEIKWSTDNETLLSIDSTGLIMARATGTAHVYAEVDGEKLECIVRCNLGGVEGEPITVSLNSTDISMFYEGETFQFKVNYENGEPEGVSHEWSSSDTSVCTIDENGIVTAVGNGTAYISTVANGINLKCIVRVNIQSSTTEG